MRDMKIESWLKQAKSQIDALDAELIAVNSFAPKGRDRSWLIGHLDEELALDRQQKAQKMLEKRVKGMPLAYILGEKEFYGRKFIVNPAVLIPRPETETLINLIKELNIPKTPKFLEIGTGSGCIGVTLALEFPQSYVLATDLSVRALEVAQQNNFRHEGRMDLVESNLLRDVEFDVDPEDKEGNGERFNVVVANLPYVNKEWAWVDEQNLSQEPAMALYARSNNGLSTYQRFLNELKHYRNEGRIWFDYLVVEADPCQHASLIKMAERAGLFHLKTQGFGLVFEDCWRYWWDYRVKDYVHKPEEVILKELESGEISVIPDEVMGN